MQLLAEKVDFSRSARITSCTHVNGHDNENISSVIDHADLPTALPVISSEEVKE